MGAIVLDASKVNSYVLPNLVKSKNPIQDAYSTSQSLRNSLPSSFTYRSTINDIVNQLYSIKREISDIDTMISKKVEKAKTIENRNDNRASGIAKAASSIGSIVGTIGGAAIGSATGGVVGTVAGAVVGNKVGNSVGKGLANTGAKVVKGVVSGVKKMGSSIVDGFKWVGSKVVSGVKTAAKWVKDTSKTVTDWVADKFNAVKDWTCKAIKNTGAWISNAAKATWSWIKGAASTVWTHMKKIGASFVNGLIALTKGLVRLVEAIGDLVILVGAGIGTIGTALYDVGKGICTGKWDWSATKGLWKGTKAVVAYDWTSKCIFDPLYNTKFGKWLDDNAYAPFKSDGIMCKILEGVGYVAGIVVISIFTCGAGGLAIGGTTITTTTAMTAIATAAGIGKYTAEEWNKNSLSITYGGQEVGLTIDYEKYSEIESLKDGQSTTITQKMTDENGKPFEIKFTITKTGDTYSIVDSNGNPVGFNGVKESSTLKGLGVGIVKGAWEGAQYYVGGKIGAAKFTSVTGNMTSPVAQTLTRSGIRVGLDMATGVAEVPFQTLMTMASEGKSWNEAWEATGGWNAVKTQAGIAGIASFAGEAFSFKGNLNTAKVNNALLSGDSSLIDDALKNADPKYINRAINELDDVQFKELVDNGMLSNDTVIKNLDSVTKGKIIEVLSAADEVDGNKIKQVTDSMSSKELSNMIADKSVSGKAKFEILGTIKDETRFKEIGKGMGYQSDSLDMYLKQLSSDSNWDYSPENYRKTLLADMTGKKVKEVLNIEYAEFKALPEDAQIKMLSSSTELTRIKDIDLQNKIAASSQTLLATKTAADNGMYTISADDVIIARMNAIKARMKDPDGVYTPAKNIIIDGKSYTELFPGCDEFISNKALVDYTKKLAKIDDSTLVDFAATLGKKYEGNELEVLAKYLETQVDPVTGITNLTVPGKIFQNASPGQSNFVTYGGNLGNTAQIPCDINITGGAYMLLSDNKTMAKNFSDCCKLGQNNELIITNYELFGEKALSGVPLNNVDGVYMFDCEVPLDFKNISIPSVNNGSMYTAYGVPGGYLLSGEMETVISGTHIDEILKQSGSVGYMGEQTVDGKKIVGYWLK